MLLHCKAGIGRTGCLVACWRISRGMDIERRWGWSLFGVRFWIHREEQLVRDYAADLKHEMEVKKFEKAIENSKFETEAKYERRTIQ